MANKSILAAFERLWQHVVIALNKKSDTDHIHDDIYYKTEVDTLLTSKANSSHNHDASNITSGTLSSNRLPTVPITKGGTGATTAAEALTNLGITATASELNYVDGVTSSIQTQLNDKAASNHTHDDRYYTETEVDTAISNAKNTWYGTCPTEMYTQSKVVTTTTGGFSLEVGNIIYVLFTNSAYTNSTLNVDGTGAVPIITTGTNRVTTYQWASNETVGFVYDGNCFRMLDGMIASTTYYGMTKLSSSTSSTSTSYAATSSAVKSAYDLANTAKTNAATAQTRADDAYTLAEGKADSSHTHDDRYYTETEIDTKLEGKADSSHGNHVPTTQTASSKVFLRNDNTWATVTPANIGAASISHGHTVSNIADLTATATELNYMDGVTSNVQTQLDAKATQEWVLENTIGKSLEGQTVSPTSTTTAIPPDTAEIFNDYRDRTFNSDGSVNQGNVASTNYCHAEGQCTTASGPSSHAEGYRTIASGGYSHAEGCRTTASVDYSHAEGYKTTASGTSSHAENYCTTASGEYSHAEGFWTKASGKYSHAAGYYTIANNFQYVVGKFNADTTAPTGVSDTTTSAGLFIVGIGTSDTARSNGFRVNPAGKVYGTGTFGTSGADYAEYFEWFDGNPDNEDRRGHFVTLEGNKIRYATPNDDYILGVVSADPSVAGDIHSEDWHNRYLKDVFGSKIVEVVDVEETTNEDGKIIPAHTERRWVLNPDYDPDVQYISREERPEWAAIGIVGKLVVVDDGTCQVNGYCQPNTDGIATASQEKTNYRVMERLDDTHIRIFIR